MNPGRQDNAQHGGTCNVGILVEGNIDALSLSLLQQTDNVLDLVPVLLAADLEVGVVDLDTGLTADLDDLFHGIQDGVSFGSLVDDKAAVVLSNNLAHLDDFLGLGVSTGHVNQTGGQADCTGFHLTTGDLAHLLQLFLVGQAVFQAHSLHTDVAVGNQVALVQAGTCVFNHLQIVLGVLKTPVDVVGIAVQTSQVLSPGADVLLGQGSHGDAVLTQNFGGDALHNLGLNFGLNQDLQIGVGVGINEAGSNHQAGGVNDFHVSGSLNGADLYDLIVLNQNIGQETFLTGTVDHQAAFDQFLHNRAIPFFFMWVLRPG